MYVDLNTGAMLFQMKDSGIHGFWYSHEGAALPSTYGTLYSLFLPFPSLPCLLESSPPLSTCSPHSGFSPLLFSGPCFLLTTITVGGTRVLKFQPPKLSYWVHPSNQMSSWNLCTSQEPSSHVASPPSRQPGSESWAPAVPSPALQHLLVQSHLQRL